MFTTCSECRSSMPAGAVRCPKCSAPADGDPEAQKTEISVPEVKASELLDMGARSGRGGRLRAEARGGGDVGEDRTEKVRESRVEREPEPEPDEDSDPEGDTGEEPLPPQDEGPKGSVGLAAAELARAMGDARAGWQEMSGADKGTVWAAIGLIGSTLAPFVGVPGDPWRPGILGGGWALVLLAVWALQLTAARARALGLVEGASDLADREGAALRRISLLHLVCGGVATAYCTWLVVLYWKLMEVRTVTGEKMTPILRPGLFVALFFATGLAYAGLARFMADAARRRRRG